MADGTILTMPALDNAIWSALTSTQSDLAEGSGKARRYLSDVSALAGIADLSEVALRDLAALVPADGELTLAQAFAIPCPDGAAVKGEAMAWQLVATSDGPVSRPPAEIVPLTEADWPAMLELALLTKPGPFQMRTPLLGEFFGVKVDGILIAMAGERMRLRDYAEISGICTHPDHQGRGLGTALCLHVRDRIVARGQVPFLHAYQTNAGAIGLYESLGFEKQREIFVTHLVRRTDAA